MTGKEFLEAMRNLLFVGSIFLLIIVLATNEKAPYWAIPVAGLATLAFGYFAAEGSETTKLKTGFVWGAMAAIFTTLAVLTS
jgi:hypothetical protein